MSNIDPDSAVTETGQQIVLREQENCCVFCKSCEVHVDGYGYCERLFYLDVDKERHKYMVNWYNVCDLFSKKAVIAES